MGFALLWLGLSMIQLALALIVTVVMGLPRASVGTVLGLTVAASLLSTSAVTALAHRIGSGQRLEGMFFAFQGLILNGTTSVSSAILGTALSILGYGLGLRAAPLLATACVLAGIVVFRRFPGAEPAA